MTNKDKALDIAADRLFENGELNFSCDDNRFHAALQMAQWKDHQLIELLPKIITCIYQGITQCATDDMIIEEVTNLIKGIKNYSK